MTQPPGALRRPGGRALGGDGLIELAGQLDAQFRAQVQASRDLERRVYQIAGRPVEVLSPSRALLEGWLASLVPWVRRGPQDAARLSVRLFEAPAGTDPLAGAAAELRALLLQGEMVTDPTLCAHAHAEGGTLSLFDRKARQAFLLHGARHPLPAWERAAPLRTLLQWWAELEGAQLVHAAGVGVGETGALIVGAGGSGKSTTALSCAAEGLAIVGDDYLWLEGGSPPVMRALYASAKVDAPRLEAWFPAWRSAAPEAAPGEKRVVPLAQLPGVRLASRLDVASILLPRVSRAPRPVVERVSAARALLALAPSSLFQLPGSRPDHLGPLARLVRTCPAFRLELAEDPAQNARAIREHLEERAIHACS